MLQDGRLHLTGMALLVPLLTPQNRDSILARATHRSKREIEELVAELMPRPDVPSAMRKLPDKPRKPVTQEPAATVTVESTVTPQPSPGAGLFPETVESPAIVVPLDGPRPGDSALPRLRAHVLEPLSPARYKVQFTASAELHDKLERLQALMRSQVRDGDLGAIIDFAVTQTLERLEARRFAKAAAPRKTLLETDTAPASRHVPAAVHRAVRKRDQDRCRFVDDEGRRCSEQHRLEFHHRHPFGMGGDHSPGNISLLCAAHNRYLAERDYGQAAMRRHARVQTFRMEPAPRGPAGR